MMRNFLITFLFLCSFTIFLSKAVSANEQACSTTDLNLMCGSNQVLQGISSTGVPKCVNATCPSGSVLRGFDANGAICGSMKWSDRCRQIASGYGRNKKYACKSNEYLVGVTVSDDGDNHDVNGEVSHMQYGGYITTSGKNGWARVLCCRDTAW